MILNVPLYNQRDKRWANKKLGFSTVSTLGLYGCLVTCLAMIAKYFGEKTDPDKMNEDLRGADGFQSKVYYNWGRLTSLYSFIKYTRFVNTPDPVTPDQFKEIDNHLAKGMPVMLKVDFNPATTFVDQHFVLLIGKVGNSYKIADPWTGTVEKLSKYGPARYAIQRYILYEGPEGGGTSDMNKEDTKKLVKELIEGKADKDDVKDDLAEIKDNIKSLTEAQQDVVTIHEKDQLIETMAELTSLLADPQTGLDAVRTKANDALDQTAKIPEMNGNLTEARAAIMQIHGKLETAGIMVGEFGLLDRLLFEVSELWRVIKNTLKGGGN